MKKLFLFAMFVFIVSFAQSQNAGNIRLQVGADYGFEMEIAGVNFGGEYLITDNISAAPNYTMYFQEDVNASSLNIDARYYFTPDVFQWYGMVGFSNWTTSSKAMGVKFKASTSGLNLGLGGVLKISDDFALNPEVKYQTIGNGQIVVKLGIVYLL